MADSKSTVLVVDDDELTRFAIKELLTAHGYKVDTAASATEALTLLAGAQPNLIISDLIMPDLDGFTLLQQFKSQRRLNAIPILLLSADRNESNVVRALDLGAADYIQKPFRCDELLARVRNQLRKPFSTALKNAESGGPLPGLKFASDNPHIVGRSKGMLRIFSVLEKTSAAETPILLSGASGTGKELLALAVHRQSARADKSFIAQNCAAFSEGLIESELFGHVKGSFTGALKDRSGLFESAHGGTLFLDEIGEMPLPAQAKLLRVLQDGTYMRVGSSTPQHADVRIIAATNRNLEEMVASGKFREDLYYRLSVINLRLPSLEEREEDIPPLVEHFLSEFASKHRQTPKQLTPKALNCLMSYRWRGNVRELKNEVERMVILGQNDEVLDVRLVSANIVQSFLTNTFRARGPLRDAKEKLEREAIFGTLSEHKWNKSSSARALGISRSSLIAKIKLFDLESYRNKN